MARRVIFERTVSETVSRTERIVVAFEDDRDSPRRELLPQESSPQGSRLFAWLERHQALVGIFVGLGTILFGLVFPG